MLCFQASQIIEEEKPQPREFVGSLVKITYQSSLLIVVFTRENLAFAKAFNASHPCVHSAAELQNISYPFSVSSDPCTLDFADGPFSALP